MIYKPRTLPAEKLPLEMRIPHVKTGYRLPYQPWSYYVKSLLHVHNESVNVWTHLIGCLLILFQTYTYYGIYEDKGSKIKGTVLGLGICCFITLFNSATAHLLHSKSCHANFLVFMYDYVGVVSWGFGTAILALYGVSSKDMYDWLGPYFVTIQIVWTYLNFINICLAKLWYGHDLSLSQRKIMVVVGISIQGLWNFIPFFPRYIECFKSSECELSSLNHVTIVCVSFICMTLAFVLHQPESTWPGYFDIIGQSHQIFHVFVILTMTLQFRCLYIDFKTNANAHCKPNIAELLAYIVILNLSCLITLYLFKGRVKNKLDNNNKEQ
ncbi:membrane progestin receptor alpha-B-like isoform X1 [Mercenaria mercenaria]|uniref:membrane progestin receptor alpha-B-like isoform X1 n=1 Tax=Mercenaria mercenaria TaxID=6596 RepID=UPI00234EE3B6|nr:membrane progestin receptor alpha-B-like isoform X1 [Mercenaria mercenaria]XP_045186288.2 membrane progestin receptor alpha-B-like isoform X1 [Mercenaria mercenaria]